jgi:ankyrin repeat protein
VLEELPQTLDETYERILKEIHKASREHAHRLLQCLTVAVRPLRVTELAEILAFDSGTATHDGTSNLNAGSPWEDQGQAVLSTCSSLITIADEKGIQVVQFSHFSVKEFLTLPRLATSSADISRFYVQLEPAHTILARACLGVLLRLDDRADKRSAKKSFPLARYAAEHWVTHAQFEGVSSHIRDAMEDLFDPEKPYFSAWRRVYDIDVQPLSIAHLKFFALKRSMDRSKPTPLYYAALCGFYDLVERLVVNHPQLVNTKGGFYTSPLAAALGRRDFKMAELLYRHGADIDIRGCYGRTPLYATSIKGVSEIAQWLLSHGADPNVRVNAGGARSWTPLHSAALYGYAEFTRTLLRFKADKNTKYCRDQISSQLPSSERHPNAAGLMLRRQDVDMNAQDKDGFTPLHLASAGGKLEVVRLLVEHGADIDVKDKAGRTAYQVALAKGHDKITKLLTEQNQIRA